jgi:putative SOS response-associated peptidase YedK
MCNLYSITTNQTAIIELTRALRDVAGNLQPMPGVFPDYTAPVVRNAPDGVRELTKLRWGMPSSSQALFKAAERRADKLRAKGKTVDEDAFKALLKAEPDKGTTNVRNTKSSHWKRWLGVENRCIVPFTSFSEFNKDAGSDIWFALDETRPLAVFAGIWTSWRSVRKVKDGPTTDDLYGFLTTDANDFMKSIHPKAMPVILTTPAEIEQWMTAPAAEALELQERVLPNDTLKIVAKGVKKDGTPEP